MTEERKKIMLALPDTLYDLYGSIELGKKIKTIIHTYKLTNNKDTVLIDIIGDTILGFYLTKDLPKKLQAELGISAEDSLTIVSEFSGLFTPVIEREKSLTGQKMEELKSLQTQFAAVRRRSWNKTSTRASSSSSNGNIYNSSHTNRANPGNTTNCPNSNTRPSNIGRNPR